MASMTHRERVVRTLSRQEPDRVPLDFGAIASSIDNNAYGRLAVSLGLPDELNRADLNDPLNPSKDVTPCAEILERFGVDTRTVQAAAPVDSQAMVQTRIDEFTYRDEWGVIWKRPRNEDAPYMYKQGPFQRDGLTMADIEKYAWPSMPEASDSADALSERARRLHDETDHAIVLSVGHSSVAPCQRLRGFSEFMEDLVLEPGIAQALLEHVTDSIVASTTLLLGQAGACVDVVSFADDLGLQDRAYFSQKMFEKQIKPYLAKCVEAIRKNTDAKIVMHSDGAIFDLIPDLIDIGIDGINPVQTTAWGMDAARLKAEFGDKIAFWGAIDTQHALPFGSPQDVRDDVKAKIEELGVGGGYVLASCHTIREEVPAENVQAMYESALEFGGY